MQTILNLLHCDIKPENIIIKNENQFILGDLGSSAKLTVVRGATRSYTMNEMRLSRSSVVNSARRRSTIGNNIAGIEPHCSPEVI